MAEYSVPLSKKDKTVLQSEYYKIHLKNAPTNIKDETLIKVTNNEIAQPKQEPQGAQEQAPETVNQPGPGSEHPGAGDQEDKGPDAGVNTGSQEPDPGADQGAGEGDLEQGAGSNPEGGEPDPNQENGASQEPGDGSQEPGTGVAPEALQLKTLTPEEEAKLDGYRRAYFGLTGKQAPESMSLEQLGAEVFQIQDKITKAKQAEQNQRAQNVTSYSYDPKTQMLIIDKETKIIRAVNRGVWANFLSKSPDNWEPYIQTPNELK